MKKHIRALAVMAAAAALLAAGAAVWPFRKKRKK